MRRFSFLAILSLVSLTAAACGEHSASPLAPVQTPSTHDTTVKVAPAHLDSLRLGEYDPANPSVLFLWPDSTIDIIPFVGASYTRPYGHLIAFTAAGIITDIGTIASTYGGITLTSDNASIVKTMSSCDYSGAPCVTVMGVLGRATLTFYVGGKTLTQIFVVQ